MALKIEYVDVGSLRTYANNAKIHTAEQIEQIKNSITQFGMNDPIAVWKDNEIIEGHGRLIACKELGMNKVPVIRLDNLTDEQRRAYTIAHNKLTMNTGFDMDALSEELKALQDSIDFTEIGFGDFELTALTSDFDPDEYDKTIEETYNGLGDSVLKVKRVIITYKDSQEDLLRELLHVDPDDELKVIYGIGELMG